MSKAAATATVKSLFASAQQDGVLSPATAKSVVVPDLTAQINAGLGIRVDDVQASEVFLLSVLADDSGSIRFVAGNTEALRDGYNAALDALAASKNDDSILAALAFLNGGVQSPFVPLPQAMRLTPQNFNPSGGTPLYDGALVTLATVLAKTQEFADAGVPARSATLIVTDGADTQSRARPDQVKALVADLLRQEVHIIAGMGVDDGSTDFQQVFRDMGLRDEWILTPKNTPSDIRRALGRFSKSAVRASQSAAHFSQAAAGGFGAP